MANNVFANSMEISCKAASGKSICAFPDVCFTPPQTPATPPGVPIPYPNTGMASDCTDGSRTVKISGQEVMLKDKSYFKKSTGDEAGAAPKKGVMTSKNMGKVYFTMWSMDVKAEGENVVRHLDMTTHNHGSYPSNTAPWPYADEMAFGPGGPCEGVDEKFKLTPYNHGCEGKQTPHHVIPDRQMYHKTGSKRFSNYTHGSAPCICVDGQNQYADEHGEYHEIVDTSEYVANLEIKAGERDKYEYADSRESAVESVSEVNDVKESDREKVENCVRLQIDNYFKETCNANDESPLKASGKRGKNIPEGAVETGQW
jgi:hypothetical protein